MLFGPGEFSYVATLDVPKQDSNGAPARHTQTMYGVVRFSFGVKRSRLREYIIEHALASLIEDAAKNGGKIARNAIPVVLFLEYGLETE